MKRPLFAVVAMLVVLSLFLSAPLSVLGNGQAGTTLSATVTAQGYWIIRYGWTIDKSVVPDTWHLFRGDSGTSRYTITVTKDSGTQEAWIEGQVCVTNGGAVATENLTIVVDLYNGNPPPKDLVASAPVDVSGNPVLDPGETGCYAYRVNIPMPTAGGTYKATARVTITNHSGYLGEPFGPSPSATTTFPMAPTKINDVIHVDDTNGGSWEFNASGSVSYDKTFACDRAAGTHSNTATIRETGQSDGASVTVNCYALNVRKTANTSFTRTYRWLIDKWADQQSEPTLSIGQQFLVHYFVKVDATYTDSDWAVQGVIGISNPAPIPAVINGVSDVISPDIAAAVDCRVTFPYILPAGSAMRCAYSASLPDATTRLNTATVTLQNYDYDHAMNAAPDSTTNFIGTIRVSFANAAINHVDECVDVSDSYMGSLGTVCYPNVPKTFDYYRWIGPYQVCGDYTVDNTASFVTNDTGTRGEDSWRIVVHVPCEGCTLTPGYWKTHSKYGPAPYDDTWALIGENTPFFLSGQSYYQVLWTSPAGGNAYYILAHQFIAAKLNILNGAASTPAVDAALAWATEFFNTYKPTDKLSKTLRAEVISYAYLLDQYNNGYIGPGHCSE